MVSIHDFGTEEDLQTSEGINKICSKISEKEKRLNEKLETILSRQVNLEAKMRNVGKALASLNVVSEDSKKLASQISHTSDLAEKVSEKVRKLDETKSRVSECQQRVHDLIDLQLCSQGVVAALKDEDYEKGAGHIHRFLSMDQTLLQKTADDVSGSITSVRQAVNTLESAAEDIRKIVKAKLEEAIKRDDLASVERFFKIFPLLGLHDEGIERFMFYCCSKLSIKAQKELRSSMDIAKAEKRSNVAFSDTFTVILENCLRVIEVNQPIIESYYGYGHLLKLVKILQKECDDEVKKLLTEFQKQRQITKRVNQINDFIKTSNTNAMGHFRKPSGSSTDKLNAKDIDALIGEITIMHSRAELYVRFIRRRVIGDTEKSRLPEEKKKELVTQLEEMLKKCDLCMQMQEILGTYLLLERYFMEESVIKAIALEYHEAGQLCSSMVDDVFFIVRKCIRRSINTQSMNGIYAVINNGATCLEQEFLKALKAPLKTGYPSGYIDLAQAYNAFQSSIQQGKLQTSDTEMARTKFITSLNNADTATEYIETLYKAISEEIYIAFPHMSDREHEISDSCLSGLKSVGDSLKAVVDFGMQQLRSSALKPRLHPWIDQFQSYNHVLTEEELSTYEAGETFAQFLIVQIDGLLNSFKEILNPRNYDVLVGMLAADVTARLERAIKKTAFNRLGGLILDQEVRTLGSFLTSATSWSVRDKLARLTQIAIILNLEKVSELSDYYDPKNQEDTPAWRLTPNEIKTVLTLRTDFKMEDIKKLKF